MQLRVGFHNSANAPKNGQLAFSGISLYAVFCHAQFFVGILRLSPEMDKIPLDELIFFESYYQL
jgi:hypothetical protein